MSKAILTGALFITLFSATTTFAAVRVISEVDRTNVRVGEKVEVTVSAIRSHGDIDPPPSHAGLQLGPEWESGAQTAESERADSSGLVKVWHFELMAVIETTSTITPVVILSNLAAGGEPLATNRVLGPPITVSILPPKVRPWWMPHPATLGALVAVAAAAFVLVRVVRRRRLNRPRLILTPYQEAMAMMAEVHANCREDRATRFFGDVERVLTGYLSRRTGRPLGSATASELAALASRYVDDPQTIADLQLILHRSTTARFSGAKIDHAQLAETEELMRRVLERLDARWVTDTPVDETSTAPDRT